MDREQAIYTIFALRWLLTQSEASEQVAMQMGTYSLEQLRKAERSLCKDWDIPDETGNRVE